MVFTEEGTIFVSTGDGGTGEVDTTEPASLAQNRNTLGGKILHIDREGRGVPGNPFWNGDPDANRSKVWATGLRNPFRIALVPGRPKTLIVGDVGWFTYEELNVVERAGDYGWPCFEGPERTQTYRERGFCVSYYERANPVAPWLAVERPPFYSITGGVPLQDAEGWPSEFAGTYVFGDWMSTRPPPTTRYSLRKAPGPSRSR
jgi:glucose/arabinose dehydrogenase